MEGRASGESRAGYPIVDVDYARPGRGFCSIVTIDYGGIVQRADRRDDRAICIPTMHICMPAMHNPPRALRRISHSRG